MPATFDKASFRRLIYPSSLGVIALCMLSIAVSWFVFPAAEMVIVEVVTELTFLALCLYAFYHMRKTSEPVILLGWSIFCLGLSLDLVDELVDVSGSIHKSLEDWICMVGILLFAAGFNYKNRSMGSLLNKTVERADSLATIAYFDQVTGLASRPSMLEHLQRFSQKGEVFNILFVDLNGFKPVNDLHGHKVGDLLLKKVGERLQQAVRKDDLVSRWGGDEFLIFAKGSEMNEFDAGRISAVFDEPFSIHSVDISLGASIGFASFPKHAMCLEELINRADIAMYHAKENNLGVVQYHQRLS